MQFLQIQIDSIFTVLLLLAFFKGKLSFKETALTMFGYMLFYDIQAIFQVERTL